jgi:predicted nucleic acid-binding protein
VLLPDSSAWIEYLRATGSTSHLRVREALDANEPLATTGPVLMEVLAGARDARRAAGYRALLARGPLIPLLDPDDFEEAASIYRTCGRAGVTVRRHVDCLIAAIAIREDVELLHADRGYDAIALHAPLRIAA